MNGSEQGESVKEKERLVSIRIWSQSVGLLVLQSFVLQHVVNLLGSGGSLQFLTVEHFFLELLNCLARGDESLRDATIATT